MTRPPLVFDCTELFNNPVETGIQRVVRRLIRQWPSDGPALHVARFDPDHGLVRISDAALAVLQQTRDGRGIDGIPQVRELLAQLSPAQQPALPADAPVLLPEVFWSAPRAVFYQTALAQRTRAVLMLAYDFLPFLQPELFVIRTGAPLMYYLRLMTNVTDVAFISEKTRREYIEKIMREAAPANAGPTLRLGSDGFKAPHQTWHPERDAFVCIGTIEARKNQELVVRCFQELWRAGYTARLVLIGNHFGPAVPSYLIDAMACPYFKWLNAASDDQVADALHSARATIFAAEIEGFGLPPVESLYVGIPVIVHAAMPSLDGVSGDGQLRLPFITVDALTAAVSSLLDDATAKDLWQQASRLVLQDWASFTQDVSTWCQDVTDRWRPEQLPLTVAATPG